MSPVLPPLAAVALSGLHDIKGIIPPPDLPPFAVSALVAVVAVSAGAFSAARKRRGSRGMECQDQAKPVDRLLKLRDAFCDGTLSQPALFDEVWDQLRSIGLTGATLAGEQGADAAGAVASEDSLALLRSLVASCDAVRYGNETLERDHVLKALDDAVAIVARYGGGSL